MRYKHTTMVLVAILLVVGASDTRGGNPPPSDAPLRGSRHDAAGPPDLFEPIATSVTRARLKQQVGVTQPVVVRLDELAGSCAGDELGLNVMPFARYVGAVERVDKRSSTRFTVVGRLLGTLHGTFIIVVEQRTATGLIRDPTRGLLFKLRYLADGVHAIDQIESALYGRCGNEACPACPLPGNSAKKNSVNEQFIPDPSSGPVPVAGCALLQPVFDMMIIYTAAARQSIGGTDAMNAECQLAIDVANGAYVNSAIDARMRLVYRGEISYDESGTLDDHLNLLAGTDDGFMDEVHSLRDMYHADFVTLFVDNADGWCGLGQCVPNSPDRAFNVVRWDCASGNFSYAHEVGHNQGCAHDRENAGGGCAAYPFSYGWRFMGNSFSTYRTVMAYAPGTRIQYFSNPNVEFDGTSTGMPTGDPNQASNALTINLRRSWLQDHRLTRFDVWVDFSQVGIGTGAFDQPYDSVAEGAANVILGVGASEQPTLWIKAGSTGETVSIDTPMFIRSCGGLVTIGE